MLCGAVVTCQSESCACQQGKLGKHLTRSGSLLRVNAVFAERLGDITGWNKFPVLTLLSSEPGNSYERLSQLSRELE
jgi:hypothetical protein